MTLMWLDSARALPKEPAAGPDYSPLSGLRDHAAARAALNAARTGTLDKDAECLLGLLASMPQPRVTVERIATALAGRSSADAVSGYLRAVAHLGGSAQVTTHVPPDGRDHPLIAWERQRARIVAGNAEAAADSMLQLLSGGDTAVIVQFYQNSFPVLDLATRRTLRSADHADRAAVLRRWWQKAAAMSGMSMAERLSEHYRRLLHADTMYNGFRRVARDAGDVTGVPLADPRHEVYVRFGEPHTPVYTTDHQTMREYITWSYPDPEDDDPILFHFSGANSHYFLTGFPSCSDADWYAARATLSAVIGALHTGCISSSPMHRERHVAAVRAAQRATERNLDRHLVLPREVMPRFAFSLLQFRSAAGPAADLVAVVTAPNAARGAGTLTLTLADTSAGISARSSTTFIDSAAAGHRTTAAVLRNIRDADYVYRVALREDDGKAGRVYGGELEVRPFPAGRLSISDVVLSRPGGEPSFRRGAHALAPFQGVIDQPAFELYAELYGVVSDEVYAIEIEILGERRLLRRPTHLRLDFEAVAEQNDVLVIRYDVIHGLPPGTYEVRLHAVPRRGAPVTRSLRLDVR